MGHFARPQLVVISAATGRLGLEPPESYLGVAVALIVAAIIYYIDELPFGGARLRRRQR